MLVAQPSGLLLPPTVSDGQVYLLGNTTVTRVSSWSVPFGVKSISGVTVGAGAGGDYSRGGGGGG